MAESELKKPEAKRVEVEKSSENKKDGPYLVTASCPPPELRKTLNVQASSFKPINKAPAPTTFNKEAPPFMPKSKGGIPTQPPQIINTPSYTSFIPQFSQTYNPVYQYGNAQQTTLYVPVTSYPPQMYPPQPIPMVTPPQVPAKNLSSKAPPFVPNKKIEPSKDFSMPRQGEPIIIQETKLADSSNISTTTVSNKENVEKEVPMVKKVEIIKEVPQVIPTQVQKEIPKPEIKVEPKLIEKKKEESKEAKEEKVPVVVKDVPQVVEKPTTNENLWNCKIVDKKFPVEFIRKLSQMKDLISNLSKLKSFNSATLESAQVYNSPNKSKNGGGLTIGGAPISSNAIMKKIQSEEEKKMYDAVNKGKKKLGPDNQTQKDINLQLNQLTPDNFYVKLNILCDVLSQESDKLKKYDPKKGSAENLISEEVAPKDHIYFMNYLFRKAEKEKKYKKIYGRLCSEIMKKAKAKLDSSYKKAFNTLLMNTSQRRFEELIREMQALYESEDTSEKNADLKQKCRDVFFGNIRFLGELFSLKLITNNIITNYMLLVLINFKEMKSKDLVRDFKIASIELLEVMGEKLDNKIIGKKKSAPKAAETTQPKFDKPSYKKTQPVKPIEQEAPTPEKKNKLDSPEMVQLKINVDHIYDEIDGIAKSTGGLDSQLVYKAKNLMERRRNKWVATRMNKDDPKTIKEVHEELEEEEYYPQYEEEYEHKPKGRFEEEYREKPRGNNRYSYTQGKRPEARYSPKKADKVEKVVETPKEKPAKSIASVAFDAYLENKSTALIPKDMALPIEFLKEIHTLIEGASVEDIVKIEATFGEFYNYLTDGCIAKDIVISELTEFIYDLYPDSFSDVPKLYEIYSVIIRTLILNKKVTLKQFISNREITKDHTRTLNLLLNVISMILPTAEYYSMGLKVVADIVMKVDVSVIEELIKETNYEQLSPVITSLIKILLTLIKIKDDSECDKATGMIQPIHDKTNYDGVLIYFLVLFITKVLAKEKNDALKLDSKAVLSAHPQIFVVQEVLKCQSDNDAIKIVDEWLDGEENTHFQKYNSALSLLKYYPNKKAGHSPSK